MKHFVIFFSLLLFATPMTSSAFTTSTQAVTRINESMAIFSITYQFGHGSYDFYLPTRAVRDQAWGKPQTTMGYAVLEDGKRLSEDGETVGFVASKLTQTEDGLYLIPQGQKADLTFYVIMQTEPEALEADYAIQVTDLPFYRGDQREYQRLNPSELQYYQTPETEFNTSNPSK